MMAWHGVARGIDPLRRHDATLLAGRQLQAGE